MDLGKKTYIDTHENVKIEYETANLGSRFLANLLDETIIILSIALLTIILVLTLFEGSLISLGDYLSSWNITTIVGILLIAYFLLKYFYYIFFEMILHGQSPGKMALKIRVIQTTGEPINFLSSFIRNLLRLVDQLPTRYFIGGLIVIYNKKSQRLGDILANTMVIKLKSSKKLLEKIKKQEEEEITNEDFNILSSYLENREFFNDKDQIDIKLFNYFYKKFKLPLPPAITPSYSLTYLKRLNDKYAKGSQRS